MMMKSYPSYFCMYEYDMSTTTKQKFATYYAIAEVVIVTVSSKQNW